MAIQFTAASTEYLEVNSTPVVAAPFTMACWFNSDSIAAGQTLLFVGDKDVANEFWDLQLRGDVVGDPLRFERTTSAGTVNADTTTGYSANTWQHACAVEASATDARVFLNGTNKGTNTTSRAPAGSDRLSIGRRGSSVPTLYMSNHIAEVAIYNIALSDAEVALLALGASPLFVHPEALVFYLPMIALGGGGTQLDWVGGRTMTETNTPASAAHPPNIFYQSEFMVGYGIPSVGSTLSGTLRMTGLMSAIPLAANYSIYASDVPKRTFVSR